MESPFFGNPWYDYTPRSHYRSPSMREVPIQRPDYPRNYSLRNRDVPVQPQSARAPKVVSIPVQHAGSERSRSDLRSDAALKIQKVFRGYLVRKSVSKIAGIKREVDEISNRISKKETEDLVRTDAKERLKVVETLMSLLLKLDSVKGVDCGVRDFRRAVIKKAIALQEKVEASAANHQTPGGHESAELETNSGLQSSEQNAQTVVNQRESSSDSTESKKKEELIEKMVEENERMVGLVTELVHRNEKQTRLLGSLSQRVEQLERALINQRLRRKKRRHTVDCREGFF
ncbi:BAG family molecular chaperone regulator 6 [Rosa chinensis]|nr:BAG family molecular chaperone regulator 6 [Rosa chinensis]